MHHDQKLQEKLVTQIEDAYAMENQIVEVLEKQSNRTKALPNIQARIDEHIEATKQHRARMEQRLNAYGKKPSAMKGALSSVMGNTMGIVTGARPETLMMDARDDYVVEHFEIATYTAMIATANAFGDVETIRAAQANMRDELEMQKWLAQHAPEAIFLTLKDDGIQIPDSAWQFSKQAETEEHPAKDLVEMDFAALATK